MNRTRRRKLRSLCRPRPSLRFSPYAWAKLLYLRDLGPTEVGGFALSNGDDLLLVDDICLIPQICTSVSVSFDDGAVADFFDEQVDRGLVPARFGRIWVHTHPGASAEPSGTDEETLQRCFGSSDWVVMFILACQGQTYARLRFNAGPGGELLLPVELDFSRPFPAANPAAWDEEYLRCVEPLDLRLEIADPPNLNTSPSRDQTQSQALSGIEAQTSMSDEPAHWWTDSWRDDYSFYDLSAELRDG